MAVKSYVQTVEVVMPKSTNTFLTLKSAPPRITFEDGDYCPRTQYDPDLQMTVRWEPDGTIHIKYATGVVEIYHPKPTLQHVVECRFSPLAEYYRIHKDGSVEHGYNGQYYYWGPEEEVEWNMSNITIESPTVCYCQYCDYGYDDDDRGYNTDDSYDDKVSRYNDY